MEPAVADQRNDVLVGVRLTQVGDDPGGPGAEGLLVGLEGPGPPAPVLGDPVEDQPRGEGGQLGPWAARVGQVLAGLRVKVVRAPALEELGWERTSRSSTSASGAAVWIARAMRLEYRWVTRQGSTPDPTASASRRAWSCPSWVSFVSGSRPAASLPLSSYKALLPD